MRKILETRKSAEELSHPCKKPEVPSITHLPLSIAVILMATGGLLAFSDRWSVSKLKYRVKYAQHYAISTRHIMPKSIYAL